MALSTGPSRPRVVLSGFFGRGNCGDEALLQAQYERLSARYDVVVSVDERGACDGFWDRYPYDRCRIVHQANLGVLAEPDVIGIHVGGGGLPHGFNAAQVVHARSLGKPAFITGVDCQAIAAEGAAAMAAYYGLFDLVSVRSAAAHEALAAVVSGCHRGVDWAVDLSPAGPEPVMRQPTAILTLREFPVAWISRGYLGRVSRLVAALQRRWRRVKLLPFCPEDERFLDKVPPVARLERERHWWDPRRMQREIAAAEIVVSLGRLHPLVFAANVGTPTAFLEPLPDDARWPRSGKAWQLAAEHGWPCFPDAEAFEDALGRGDGALSLPAGFAAGTRERGRDMVERLETRLVVAAAAGNKEFGRVQAA